MNRQTLAGLWAALAWAAGLLSAGAQLTQIVSFTNLAVAIPDGSAAGVAVVRNLASPLAVLSSVRVRLEVQGDFNGDLFAYVRHESGQSAGLCVLLNRPGREAGDLAGYADPGFNVVFDDAAAGDAHLYRDVTNLPAGLPLTGSWQPDARAVDPDAVLDSTPRTAWLSAFAGMAPAGEWTLFLADLDYGGTSTVLSWELELTGQAAPEVSWPQPEALVYGGALDARQLCATSPVPGVFAYDPPLGTVLPAGLGQVLSLVFTPADTQTYVPARRQARVDVARRPLVIRAAAARAVYGAPMPVWTAQYAGFVNGDTTNSLESQVILSSSASAGSLPGVYPITAGGARGSNYVITFEPGVLTVDPAQTAVSLVSSANPALGGQWIEFAFAASAVAPGAGIPTGRAQLRIDGTNAGPAAVLEAGAAVLGPVRLASGYHVVEAGYEGDGRFDAGVGRLVPDQLVNSAPVARPDTVERYATNGARVAIAALLDNDNDPDGDPLEFVSAEALSAGGGGVSRQGDWLYYTAPAGVTNGDSFHYTIRDSWGATASSLVSVVIKADDGLAARLSVLKPDSQGRVTLQVHGVPGRVCRVEYTRDLLRPQWQTAYEAVVSLYGTLDFVDPVAPGESGRFYRTVYP